MIAEKRKLYFSFLSCESSWHTKVQISADINQSAACDALNIIHAVQLAAQLAA